eukprot:SAG31_NODE_197_length_20660_cov_8.861368_4_plen_448_part_00
MGVGAGRFVLNLVQQYVHYNILLKTANIAKTPIGASAGVLQQVSLVHHCRGRSAHCPSTIDVLQHLFGSMGGADAAAAAGAAEVGEEQAGGMMMIVVALAAVAMTAAIWLIFRKPKPAPLNLIALMPLDTPQATEVEKICETHGVNLLGVQPDLAHFEDAVLAKVDTIVSQKGNRKMFGEHLHRVPKLKWIQTTSAGVEHILPCEAIPNDVQMTNASSVYTDIIAEYCIAACLHFEKKIWRREASRQARMWDSFKLEADMRGKTLGVIGFGDIGREVARIAKQAFQMKVYAVRRRPPSTASKDPLVDRQFSLRDLESMLKSCDFVVMATPWTPQTNKMLTAAHFAAMKKTAVFINVGRGKCIDEKALLEALDQNQLGGAALDVTEVEPVSEDWAGFDLPDGKLLMSCHCCDQTHDMTVKAARHFGENLGRYVRGQPLQYVVDKNEGY